MTDMQKGQKKYLAFINKEKKKGKTHAEAVASWKEHKNKPSPKQPKSPKVSKEDKPKSRPKPKKKEGFQRPKGIYAKLRSQKLKSRINISEIKKVY